MSDNRTLLENKHSLTSHQKPLKLGLAVCVYSDPVGLARLLDSVYYGVDALIVVHARYSHFPLKDPLSLSHTRAVLQRFPNTRLIPIDEPISQIKARTRYMRAAGDMGCDVLIVLDSDEYIASDANWDLFRENLQKALIYCPHSRIFDLYTGGPIGQSGPRPRIFYKPATISYYKHHYWFVINETKRLLKGVNDSGYPAIKGITILHDKITRTKEHFDAMLEYAAWQQWGEK